MQRTIIQKTVAVFLLLVFAVSIAPKAYFHDLIAQHKDFSDCRQLHKTAVLHVQGYNCHFDDLVVSVPFLLLTEQPTLTLDFCPGKKQPSFYSSHLSTFFQHRENRGPPCA